MEMLKLGVLLTKLAYKKDKRIKQELEANGLKLVAISNVDNIHSPFNNEGVDNLRYFVADDERTNTRYYSIRGSNGTFHCWLSNLLGYRVSRDYGKIHTGFNQEALSLYPDITKYKDNTKKQIGFGFSKGSALIQILAKDLELDYAVGIGSAFFASREYARNMEKGKTKYINCFTSLDVVSLFTRMLFTPVGDTYYINKRKKIVKNPTLIRKLSDKFINLVLKRIQGKSAAAIIRLHSLDNYIDIFKVNHRKGWVEGDDS